MVVVGFVLIILGIIIIIAGPVSKKKNDRCSMQTVCTLKEILKARKNDPTSSTKYIYSYYADGIEYTIKSPIPAQQSGSDGDKYSIWYNPAKPEEAQVFHSDSSKSSKVMAIIGIVMLLLGVILSFISLAL